MLCNKLLNWYLTATIKLRITSSSKNIKGFQYGAIGVFKGFLIYNIVDKKIPFELKASFGAKRFGEFWIVWINWISQLTPLATLAKLLLAPYSAWLPAPSWLWTAFFAWIAELCAKLVRVAPLWSPYPPPILLMLLKPPNTWDADTLWSAWCRVTKSFEEKYPADAPATGKMSYFIKLCKFLVKFNFLNICTYLCDYSSQK